MASFVKSCDSPTTVSNGNTSYNNGALQTAISWASLTIQWLGFQCFQCRGVDPIPDQGTKIPHAVQPKNK